MKVNYRTKEESKRLQEQEFLNLSPKERFDTWLGLMYQTKKLFPNAADDHVKDNFVIVIQAKQQ